MSDLRTTTDPELLAQSTRALTQWMETTGTLAKEFVETLEKSSTSKVLKSLKSFGSMFKSMAKASFQTAALSLLMEILQPLIDLFQLFSPIFQALGLLLQALFFPVMQDLMPVIQFIANAIIQLIPYAMQLWDIIKLGLIVAFQTIVTIIQTIIKIITGVFLVAWNTIINVFQTVVGVIQAVINIVSGIFMGIWNGIVTVFQTIYDVYQITVGAVWTALLWVFGVIRDTFRTIINVIIDIINGVMNLLTVGLWADIPHFAKGGIVTQAMPAVVGDVPEAIIPLDQAGGMLGGASEEYLMDIKDLMEEQIAIQRRQARGLQRRRFG